MAAVAAAVLGASGIAGVASSHVQAASPAPSRAAAPAMRLRPGVMPTLGSPTRSLLPPASSPAAAPPNPHLVYYGGRVVSGIRVLQVLYGSPSSVTYEPFVQSTGPGSIGAFYSGVTNSTYVDLMSEYDTTANPQGTAGTNQTIVRGVFDRQVAITPSAANDPFSPSNNGFIDDTQVQAELQLKINAGTLPPPAADAQGNMVTLYALYFPRGVTITIHNPDGTIAKSGIDFCAYHGTTAPSPEAYYSVLPDFTTGGMQTRCGASTLTDYQRVTAVSSHELAEGITDPEVGLAAPTGPPGPPLAWYDPNNGETGDICNLHDGTTRGGDGVTYTVQQIWSNAQGACVVGPAAPPPPPFAPRGVGAPQVAMDGSTQLVFWQGLGGDLIEAWWNGRWNGPVDWTAARGWGSPLASAPSVSLASDGTQLIFWRGSSGHLVEVWWNGQWNGPIDWTAARGWGSLLGSAPGLAVAPNGTQIIFWQGAGGHLDEVWWNGTWNGPADWTASNGWSPSVSSTPSATYTTNGTQLIFWEGTAGHLEEAWWNGTWNGPVDWTAARGWGSPLGSAPSATIGPDGTQLIFWEGGGGHLDEAWWNGTWNGPVDWTAANGWGSPLTSAPSATIQAGGTQLIFWQGGGGHLIEAWWNGTWNGPVDWSS
ncbi:MAG: hypothetical protein ACRENL_03985 [Candidatus Dormibacteria bacterium]